MRTKAGWLLFIGATLLACSNDGGSSTSPETMGVGGDDTWTSYAQGFFAAYCVECHNPNDPARDYNKLDDVKKDAPTIRCGVAATAQSGCSSPPPKQFPISDSKGTNPKPSDAERARIVAWIDAGLPQ